MISISINQTDWPCKGKSIDFIEKEQLYSDKYLETNIGKSRTWHHHHCT